MSSDPPLSAPSSPNESSTGPQKCSSGRHKESRQNAAAQRLPSPRSRLLLSIFLCLAVSFLFTHKKISSSLHDTVAVSQAWNNPVLDSKQVAPLQKDDFDGLRKELRNLKSHILRLEGLLKKSLGNDSMKGPETETIRSKTKKIKAELIESQLRAAELAAQDQRSTINKKVKDESSSSIVATAAVKTTETPRKSKKPMNILLLYADDWRYDTLGIAGNAIVKTPTLDNLARRGMRFTENCVTTSVCWVSRVTLYSGLYMARHNTTRPRDFFANWTECIYDILKQKGGYYVGHSGKWGVNHKHKHEVDFQVEEDGWHYDERAGYTWHITEKNEADALRFLRQRNTTKPFFLNMAFFATHAVDGDVRQYLPQNKSLQMYADSVVPIPMTATEEAWKKLPYFFDDNNEGRSRWRWRFDTPEKHQLMMKNYYRMATEVDTACGVILDELERQGELDNTFIIFTTDNGNFHAEHGLADKWYPHQESIRVPLIIVDPRMAVGKHGTINEEFTLNLDLAPTILSVAGLSVPSGMMGRDIAELYLKDDTKWRSEFFYEHPIISHKEYIPSSEALVRKNYKYFFWPDYNVEQLFDIKADPREENDIIASKEERHITVLNEMRRRFLELKEIIHSDQTVTL